jgi:hypothetical protein
MRTEARMSFAEGGGCARADNGINKEMVKAQWQITNDERRNNVECLNDERVPRCFRFDIWGSGFVIPSLFVIAPHLFIKS